jgi:phosphoenolpyruvate-protein phosphotransferase/dihydroxyacetone kinase phosphotransfer subunit
VSHSRSLARSAVALAAEMLQGGDLRIEVAAGLDDTTFGTDAVAIAEAIERADGPAGVVVLMDLGSAVLSTELALDLVADPTLRDRVLLSPAPLVEGLVVAAVAAAGGADRAEVAAEARDALIAKSEHLSTPEDGETPASQEPGAEEVGVFTVENPHGLHARPAARLVSEVRTLDASVELRNLTTSGRPVPAASLSRVATLGALQGHEIEVRASGPQARDAVQLLQALATSRFGETEEPVAGPAASPSAGPAAGPAGSPATRQTPSATTRGPLPAAPGIAVGPVRRLTVEPVDVDPQPKGDPDHEWQRLDDSLTVVRRELEQVREDTARAAGEEQAGIFDAHLSLLDDDDLLTDVRTRIDSGTAAATAWRETLAEVERDWAALPDPYLRERAADVRAVADQVLRALTGASAPRLRAEGVLVAEDLTPADAAGLDLDLVTGVVLAGGSPTSHAAILARTRDIPVVVAAGPDVLSVPEGTTVVLDGGTGELHVDPGAELLEEFRRRASEATELRTSQLERAAEPAVAEDGTAFVVAANLGSIADAEVARAAGADGAGLVRTEFLFLDRSAPPGIEEQQEVYDAIAEALGGRPVTWRTLDVGGDKPLPYLPMPHEENPFLGQRGIRLSLEHRDLLRDQLAALCLTARHSPTSVMVPMVSTPAEMAAAREVLLEAAGPDGLPEGLRVGTMIEVPAAALKIEAFLPHVDFVSIGTNDLTQYTLAAERGNGAVASLFDALDPGVLRLVDQVCRAADGRVDVAVCGEAGSDEQAIPVLVGLGVRELSVSPPAVPRVKAALRQLDVGRCRALAAEALTLADAAEVRALVSGRLAELSA